MVVERLEREGRNEGRKTLEMNHTREYKTIRGVSRTYKLL
jgi:hypothetical protein